MPCFGLPAGLETCGLGAARDEFRQQTTHFSGLRRLLHPCVEPFPREKERGEARFETQQNYEKRMTLLTFCTVLAAVCYLGSGIAIVGAMKGTGSKASALIRWPVLLGVLLQGYSLHDLMFSEGGANFGFGFAMSEMFFFAVIILLIETWIHRLHGQFGIVLIAAAVGALLPLVFPGQAIASAEWTLVFRWHLILAIAAYAFLMIAFVHAILLTLQNRRLKMPALESEPSSFLDSMPGLVVMERIFFRIVSVGFAFITLTLIVGAFATHEAKGVWFYFDHKMILTWLAWILFGILLVGRAFAGWRAKTALSWFWAGFTFFVVAYFGYSFVLELTL